MVKLTPAEKQRRYREKRDMDADKRAAYLQKERVKYLKDKQSGKKKSVVDMTKREHRCAKKNWREKKRAQRAKNKVKQTSLTTPACPSTPKEHVTSPSVSQISRQKLQYFQKVVIEKESLKTELVNAKEEVQKLKHEIASVKKTCLHQETTDLRRNGTPTHASTIASNTTPSTKAKMLVSKRNRGKLSKVRKTLTFHYAVMDQLKQSKKRKALKEIAKADIMKKYKLKSLFCRTVGIKVTTGKCNKSPLIAKQEKLLVRDFFLRSDNAKIVNGKKNTVTRFKIKKQKRLLCDTLYNMYNKFSAENNVSRFISFTTFWRLKPFWVKQATETDRKTCQCKTCENTKFQANTLFRNDVLKTSYLPILLQDASCSVLSKRCMYGECNSCEGIFQDKNNMEGKENKQVSWFQWKNKKEKRILLNKKEKEVSFITKECVSGPIIQLWGEFCKNMTLYKRHAYNINRQFKHFERIKHNLKPSEMLVHIDFAQNYVGKLHTEVQSKHFGASKTQISLHTGFYQISSQHQDPSEKTMFSFCGVSDSLKHTPSAVWAYLEPILTEVKSKYKEIDVIHFFSDGPSSQYRQKTNFFLFNHFMKEIGFKHAIWNFFEAGHGKGVPDAVGSSVKQAADRLVKYGHDIITAADLVKHVGATGTETKLYEISLDKIEKYEDIIPDLKAVPGTMKLHQLQVCQDSPNTITYRDVSCSCDGDFCDNFWKVHSLQQNQNAKGLKHEACACVANSSCSVKENLVLSPSYKLDTAAALHTLQLCDSFGLLRHECEALQFHLEPLTGRQRSLSGDKLTLNTFSSQLIPTDVKEKTIFAVKVRADGDCLPGSGSVFAYGNDQMSEEIRLRIIVESVLYSDFYLDEDNLRKGFNITCTHSHELQFAHAMYSDAYIPGVKFNPREIYEKEVMSLTKPKSFMGIWQLFALSSVLRMPIFSMYPDFHGQVPTSQIRNHLHRLILPRVQSCEKTGKILWCSTRSNNAYNWLPNHFVPCVPFKLSD